MARIQLHPNSFEEVRKRLKVERSWMSTQLRIDLQDIDPTKRLTRKAISYLEYCKGGVAQSYMDHPGKDEIFVDEQPAKDELKDEITASAPGMYAVTIKLSSDCFVIPNINPGTRFSFQDKNGRNAIDVIVITYFGIKYHCEEITITSEGIYLHHVWGIFVE